MCCGEHVRTHTHMLGLSIATEVDLLKQCCFLTLVFLPRLRIQSNFYDSVTCNGERANPLSLDRQRNLPSCCVQPGTPRQHQVAAPQVARP